MTFDNGRLIDNITHLVPGRDDLLGALDRGDFDAALLDLRRFDAYRAAHPDTRLAASGYFYPVGANRGYVGLDSDKALLAAVEASAAKDGCKERTRGHPSRRREDAAPQDEAPRAR